MKFIIWILAIFCASFSQPKNISDSQKVAVIKAITHNLTKYDSLYQTLPDSALIQKRVLKQIMENDLLKLTVAEKNEQIIAYEKTNALRWVIGNIGFLLFLILAYFAYRYREKGRKIIVGLIISTILYILIFNLIPEFFS